MTDKVGLEACFDLAAFRPTLFADVASLVWDRAGQRIVTANPVAARMFRSDSIAALGSETPDLRQPGFQHLTRVGETFTAGQPRLERLRFFIGFRPVMMSALCQVTEEDPDLVLVTALETLPGARLEPAEKAALVAAELDGTAAIVDCHGHVLATTEPAATDAALTSALVDPEGIDAHPGLEADVFDGPDGTFSIVRHHPESVADATGVSAAPQAPIAATEGDATTDVSSGPGADDAVGVAEIGSRFRVILDRAGRISESEPGLAALGLAAPAATDMTLVGFLKGSGAEAAQKLGQALAARDTFSGEAVQWPTADDAIVAGVAVAGLPLFDGEGVFDGFRCFGVIESLARDETAISAPPAVAPVAAVADETSAAPEPDAVPAPLAPNPEDTPDDAGDLQPESDEAEESRLAPREQQAFAAIAAALGASAEAEPEPETRQTEAVETVEDETAKGSEVVDVAAEDAEAVDEVEEASAEDPETDSGQAPAEVDVAEGSTDIIDQPAQRSVTGTSDERAETLEEMWRQATGNDDDARPAEQLANTTAAAPIIALTGSSAAQAAPSFSEMMDRLPVGLMFMRDDQPLYANRAFLDLFGYPDLDDLEIAGGLSALFENFAAIGGETGLKRVLAGVTRDGDPIDVEARLQTARWVDGPALLLTARERARVDTSQLLEAKTALFELENVLNTATDGVVVLDPDGTVEKLNSSAEALFGYDSEEMKDRPFTDLLAEESRSEAGTYLEGVIGSGMESLLNDGREVVGRVKQGGEIPLFLTLGVIGTRETPKYCAVLRDLTQWKQAEAELTDAKRDAETASSQKSEFLAKISHEIRTPLNAIIGFAEVMMEERFGPIGNERYKEYVSDIRASGEHMMSLVNDLLDLSKIESGRMELNFVSVQPNDIVEQCVAIMQAQANRDRVILRTSLAHGLPAVVADARSLRQILLNLLSNAVKFTRPGGQVIVSTVFDKDGEVLIRVRDTGVGMSEGDIATALEPFRQVGGNGDQTDNTGSGLGLPLTKALAEANRAQFTIESKLDQGTMVQVAFPSTRVLAE